MRGINNMKRFGEAALPWAGVILPIVLALLVWTNTIGGNSKQTEVNTKNIDKIEISVEEIERATNDEYKELKSEISEVQRSLGVIEGWVKAQE
jgi:hypothetical protein